MPIPFTVIGGFLGAGKTTLMNRVLREAGGVRYAVLVNDFGALNIDAELIAEHGGETVALANGCICCSIGDSLVETLVELMSRPDPADHILVEASGVANPARIADVAVIDPALSLDGTVVLVDAEAIAAQVEDKLIGETVCQQLNAADILVCNKSDLTSPDEQHAVLKLLDNLAPGIPVVVASQADIPLDAVLGQGGPRKEAGHANPYPHHDDRFHRAEVVSGEPPRRAAFEAALDGLPSSVLRGKGFVRFAEEPERTYLLHLVGRRWSLAPSEAVDAACCRLVFIGTAEMPVSGLPGSGQ